MQAYDLLYNRDGRCERINFIGKMTLYREHINVPVYRYNRADDGPI